MASVPVRSHSRVKPARRKRGGAGPFLARVTIRAAGRLHFATDAPEPLHMAYARAKRLRTVCADPVGVRIIRPV